MSCDRQNQSRLVSSNKHDFTQTPFFMNELIIQPFGKESNYEFPVIQDGDYALTMDSASLSNLLVHLETIVVLKLIFCCH